MKRTISALLCVFLALSSIVGIASSSSFLQNPDAIEEAIKSVLFIAIFDENDEITATGSGFVAFNNRTIVTNHHVIEGADSIWASDESDNVYEIDRVIAMDEEKDIAILSIKELTNLIPLKLAESTVLKRGQPILTIGSPEGLKNSVSSGIISAVYDQSETPDIQFTAPISHGSSGGALFDDKGEVIGITSAFYTEGQNINFAVGIYHVIDLYRKHNPNYDTSKQIVTSTPFMPTATPELSKPVNISVKMIGNMVAVNWSEGKEALGYRVYRSNSANGPYTFIGRTSIAPFFDKNVSEGKTYYYKVASSNGAMISDMSGYIMLSIPTATPTPTIKPTPVLTLATPKNLNATLSGSKVTIKWTKVNEASYYQIYRAISAKSEYSFIGRTSTDAFVDNDAVNGKTYFYKVLSENSTLLSDFSDYIAVVMPTPTPKPTPSPTPAPISYISQEESAKYKALNIGTNDPDVARLKKRMYELGYSNSKTGNNNFTEKTADYVKEFQRVNGLPVDGIASPMLQALLFSDHAYPKPSPTPKPTPRLSKPSSVKAKVSGTTVTVTWSAVKGATQYTIYRSIQPNGFYGSVGSTSTNNYIDSTAVRGFTYYYKVESIAEKNVSDKSSYAKAVMPKPTPTPYTEPKYPIEIGHKAYVGTISNPSLNPLIMNISERKTVDGFTVTYFCQNVYQEFLTYDGTNINSTFIYKKTIKPGQSLYPGAVNITGLNENAAYINVAIIKIHTTDGKTYNVPESEWDFHQWSLN